MWRWMWKRQDWIRRRTAPEIGAVKVEDGEIRESYEMLINTGVPIPYRIQELTGITDEMQKAGNLWRRPWKR